MGDRCSLLKAADTPSKKRHGHWCSSRADNGDQPGRTRWCFSSMPQFVLPEPSVWKLPIQARLRKGDLSRIVGTFHKQMTDIGHGNWSDKRKRSSMMNESCILLSLSFLWITLTKTVFCCFPRTPA